MGVLEETVTAQVIGTLGGVALAVCSVPQAFVMWKNKSARDVSLSYTILYCIGLTLTLVYMILINALVAIITISFEVVIAYLVLALKIYYDAKTLTTKADQEVDMKESADTINENSTNSPITVLLDSD